MNKKLRSKEVKEFAFSHGVSMVGVAPVERFNGAPRGHRPTDFIKDARSVIVQGIRLLPSVVDWRDYFKESEHLTPSKRELLAWGIYHKGGYAVVNQKLELLALDMALFMENQGFRCIFFPVTGPYDFDTNRLMILRPYWYRVREIAMEKEEREYKKEEDEKGKIKKKGFYSFSHRHAAVLAGLGRFGLNNLVLTPDYGPRMRFISVITTAEIEPDPLIKKEICLHPKTGCTECIDKCPFNALTSPHKIDLCGLKMLCSDFDVDKCPDEYIICGGVCINVCPIGKE